MVKSWLKELWEALCEPGPQSMGLGLSGTYCPSDIADYLEGRQKSAGSGGLGTV